MNRGTHGIPRKTRILRLMERPFVQAMFQRCVRIERVSHEWGASGPPRGTKYPICPGSRGFPPTLIFEVHPGLVWVEAEASAVEEDGGFEVLSVPEATDPSFDGHDFAIHSFGDGICDFVGAVTHNISQTVPD